MVDDGSRDGTWQQMQRLAATDARIRIFRHEVNRGKGAAVRTGIAEVQAGIVIIQDADLEYDPDEYPKLLAPILAGHAEVVFGTRFAGEGIERVVGFWQAAGNRFLTFLSNRISGLRLTDMETCYKVFRREILAKIVIQENCFGVEPEITAKLARLGVPIHEVAISFHRRIGREGKKIGWRDGLRAVWCILKYQRK